MDTPKKIIILHASAGHGHRKAAEALGEAFKEGGYSAHVQVLDALQFLPVWLANFYRNSYLFQITYIPLLWGFFYFTLDIGWVYGSLKGIRRRINASAAKALESFLIKENPDWVIATHFLPTEVVSFLKENNKINSKLLTIITDYLPHWIWTAPAVDVYAVAIQDTKQALMDRGVPNEKILVTGIPIEAKFLLNKSRGELMRRHCLNRDLFSVLITSGGAGLGMTKELVQALVGLNLRIQIIVVSGNNKKTYRAISKMARENDLIKVFGFVGNMDELMMSSDVVIGKGGGLTITESFAKEKPVILLNSVPGQETRNNRIVRKYKAGFSARSIGDAAKLVARLARDKDELRRVAAATQAISKPNAARVICQWVMDGK